MTFLANMSLARCRFDRGQIGRRLGQPHLRLVLGIEVCECRRRAPAGPSARRASPGPRPACSWRRSDRSAPARRSYAPGCRDRRAPRRRCRWCCWPPRTSRRRSGCRSTGGRRCAGRLPPAPSQSAPAPSSPRGARSSAGNEPEVRLLPALRRRVVTGGPTCCGRSGNAQRSTHTMLRPRRRRP